MTNTAPPPDFDALETAAKIPYDVHQKFLRSLGGLIFTMRSGEGVLIQALDGVLIIITHAPQSSSQFRVRILAKRDIGVKRLSHAALHALAESLVGRKGT